MSLLLTDTEKATVIMHLGWPGLTIVPDSTDYSKPIVDNLTSATTPMVAQVRAYLVRIAAIDTRLDSAACRLSAKEVGDIVLRDDEIYQLKKEKRRLCMELSRLLDIAYLQPMGGPNIGVTV